MKIAALLLGLCLPLAAGVQERTAPKAREAKSAQRFQPVDLAACPAPVKKTIADYATKYTFEKVEIEKASPPPRYRSWFHGPDGRPLEITMGSDGKVQPAAKPQTTVAPHTVAPQKPKMK